MLSTLFLTANTIFLYSFLLFGLQSEILKEMQYILKQKFNSWAMDFIDLKIFAIFYFAKNIFVTLKEQ